MEKIVFKLDGEAEVAFYVLEQTTIGGQQYILVTDSEDDEDGEGLILKELSTDEADSKEADSVYMIVDDETELDAVAAVFNNLLEDITLTGEE